jgi:hypothetical protein
VTTAWTWPVRDRRNFWERARTLAQDYAEPVVRVLEVPGAFVPGASTALSKIGELFGSDLNISELDSGEVLHALDGAPGPYASRDGSSPVFIHGVNASMTAAHNAKGRETILLERIDLQIIAYEPAPIPSYDEQIDASRVFGAGFVEPMRFLVEVGADGPTRARRAIRGTDGKREMLVAEGPNFLDTDPASFLSLAAQDPPAMFKVTVAARDPGLYTICFRWFYRISARELRQHTSLPIVIYRGM